MMTGMRHSKSCQNASLACANTKELMHFDQLVLAGPYHLWC